MTECHCGGRMVPAPSGLDTTAHPALTGLMLACEDCGRPMRLLHDVRMGGRETRAQRRMLEKRVMRSARRMQLKHAAREE